MACCVADCVADCVAGCVACCVACCVADCVAGCFAGVSLSFVSRSFSPVSPLLLFPTHPLSPFLYPPLAPPLPIHPPHPIHPPPTGSRFLRASARRQHLLRQTVADHEPQARQLQRKPALTGSVSSLNMATLYMHDMLLRMLWNRAFLIVSTNVSV